jgi:hypothetical protein
VTVSDGDLHGWWHRDAIVKGDDTVMSDVGVVSVVGQLDLEIIGDAADTLDALRSALGRQLGRIRLDIARERDDAVAHGDADARRVEVCLELELHQHGIPDDFIRPLWCDD